MERATALTRSSTRTTDILDFLRRELAPTPERWSATLRLTLACVAATIPVMVFRLHLPLIVMILMYLITKEDTTATLVGTIAGILGVSIGLSLALLVYIVALDVTWLRVCLVPAFVGGGLFLNRILVLPSLGTAIGLPAAMGMIVPDVLPPGVLDRFLFWLWWSVVLGLGINLGVQLLLNPKNALDRLVEALSTRLRAVEGAIVRILAGLDGVALPPSGPPAATLALSGVASQLQLLKIVEMRYGSLKPYHAELNALITFVDRLLTAAAALEAFNPEMLGEQLRRRLQRVADACADMRRAIEQRRWPEHVWPSPATTLAGEENSLLPPLTEMERVLAMMPLALPSGATSSRRELPSADAAEHRRLLVPDAFTNPEYGQFAIKGALAATVCYLIFTGADYPGIYTSVITVMVCSLSTIGASTQKGVLRFAGSAIGGLMGVFTILYVFPHLDSLGGFWLPFGAGTAVAAYVNFGSPRLSYCGYQIGLAFYKAVLQGYGPATELKVVKDRLIGIALGLLVFGLIDTQLWPVRAAASVRPSFANALRSMADLARLPSQDEEPAMILSRAYALRLKIYQGFGTVQQLVAETMFEPGATEREVMLQLLAEAQAAFLVLLALVQDRADAALRGGPVMAREAANRCDAAVAESFEALAAGIEGQQRRPWPDLAGALAALERDTAAHLHDSTAAATAPYEHGRLALYRQLVPLVERLGAHHQALVLA
jgi:multidrug resistance protein MdtO